jgi:hypothetical protein
MVSIKERKEEIHWNQLSALYFMIINPYLIVVFFLLFLFDMKYTTVHCFLLSKANNKAPTKTSQTKTKDFVPNFNIPLLLFNFSPFSA